MDSSFLLISCTIHKNLDVANELRNIYGVKEAVPVYGTFDCIVKTEEMQPNDVQELVSSSIRPLDNIQSVLVLYTSQPQRLIENTNV